MNGGRDNIFLFRIVRCSWIFNL